MKVIGLVLLCWWLSMLVFEVSSIYTVDDVAALLSEYRYDAMRISRCYSIDGVGNNLKHPLWGSAGQPFSRLLGADYADGFNSMKRMEVSAREVSNMVSAEVDTLYNEFGCTDWLWLFGQFIDHDTVRTIGGSESEPIPVPEGDIMGIDFLGFTRTEKSHHVASYLNEPREHANHVTTTLDLSVVYGSSYEKSHALRGDYGKLKTGDGNLLPKNFMVGEKGFLENFSPGAPQNFFVAGDIRSNENFALTVLQTIFLREHNRIADIIQYLSHENDIRLSSDDIFYLARMITTWEYQSIIYYEFLPALIGKYSPHPRSIRYDDKVNPMISTEFSTAAYRFGHSMVSPYLPVIHKNGETMIDMKNGFLNPDIIETYGVDAIVRGLGSQVCRKADTQIVEALRGNLFKNVFPGTLSFDLAARNIQRGRDHGLPGFDKFYNHYKDYCSDEVTFDSITNDRELSSKLQDLYGDIQNVDPWVGLLAEKKDYSKRSQFGHTLSRIISDTFAQLVRGDRCFHSHHRHISDHFPRTTLAEIIVHNTGVHKSEIPGNVFYI